MDGRITLVSSCLLGIPCRYDAQSKPNEEALRLFESGCAIAVCPECLGGLPTPRPAAEIIGGGGEDVLSGCAKVMSRDECGELHDVTREFILGAYEALRIALSCGADTAWLKSKSPSCGCGEIYDGSFCGRLREGCGVTAALFLKNGIGVRSL